MRDSQQFLGISIILLMAITLPGCKHGGSPSVTAVSLTNPDEPEGIPFYLPKPLLIISKNFRNIETVKTGLTDTVPIPDQFDDQAKYADLNARTNFVGLNPTSPANQPAIPPIANATTGTAQKSGQHLFSGEGAPISPGSAPSDGLSPKTFYTYQIVFVPDLTQKYGLRIKGGAGEIRAAMNLVNGWQFTGLGPYYMKDSSTAQDILSGGIATRLGGQAVADVLKGVADLTGGVGGATESGLVYSDQRGVQELSTALGSLPTNCVPMTICDFAEIHVFEASLGFDGQMVWQEIAALSFNRDYLGTETCHLTTKPAGIVPPPPAPPQGETTSGAVRGATQSTLVGEGAGARMARSAVASVLGIPSYSPALQPGEGGQVQSGAVGGVPGAVAQINVNCGDDCESHKKCHLCKLRNAPFCCHHHEERRGKIESRQLVMPQFLHVPNPNFGDRGLADEEDEAKPAIPDNPLGN